MSDSDKKPITRTRRRWAFRLVGLGIGFALLAALELFIRLTGWGLAIGSHTGYLKPIGLPFFQCQQEAGGQKTCRTSKYYPKPYANNEQFRMPKPKSTVRIFCVVASTTAGVPFFKPGAFPYFLSMALETVAPYPRHEVINAGHAGASSLEVGLIVSGLYKYDPDWIVIYTGNNEFLVHGSKVNSERHSRLRYFFKRWLNRLMSYRVMKGIFFSVVITPLPLQPLDSSDSILARATTFRAKVQEEHWEDQAREVVRSSFQRNLDDMVRDIRARGVGVILCTIPVNLKNYPPFDRDDESLVPKKCPDELQTKNQSDIMLTPGGQKIDCKKLMSGPRELTGEDGLKAFQLGHCALAAGNYKEAKKRLVQALENDSFPTRATPALNRIIRNTARSRQVILADVESSFDQAAADRIPGDDIFVDNVHPTLSGNYLIALTILESMARERVVDLPLEWRGRVDREVSIYLSRMPEDYLSQAYLFNAKANATKGLFCRALDMCGQALLFSPDNQQAALLKSNINELFKNGRSVVPDTYNQGR